MNASKMYFLGFDSMQDGLPNELCMIVHIIIVDIEMTLILNG